jgi:hypothetical protein
VSFEVSIHPLTSLYFFCVACSDPLPATLHFQVDARLDAALCSRVGLNPDSTVLHYAAKHGFGQSVQAIVRKWKDGLECKNKAQETPLDLAPLYIRPLVKPGLLDSLRVMRQATVAGECVRTLAECVLGCTCACASREIATLVQAVKDCVRKCARCEASLQGVKECVCKV